MQQVDGKRPNRGEVADETEAGKQRQRNPEELLQRFFANFFEGPRRFVELHALAAVAFNRGFDPGKRFRPDRLRAGKTAPEAAGKRRKKEQADGENNQQQRQVDKILWPERQPEDIELACGQVEQYGLSALPQQPRPSVESTQQDEHRQPSQGREATLDFARVYFVFTTVELTVLVVAAGLLCHG